MDYVTGPNDTFQSIAIKFAGSADYAEAIAGVNGMNSDVLKVPLNVVLEEGIYLRIPDSIIPAGGVRIDVVGGALTKWIDTKQIVTLVLAGVIMAMLTRNSRKR